MDETDLQLLHLLQIAPRISWASAADVLGMSPGALGARWRRLRSEGLAWMAVHPDDVRFGATTAFLEIGCAPSDKAALVRRLCEDPRVVSCDQCTRGRDVLLTVMVPSVEALASLVLHDLAAYQEISATRTSVVTQVHADGSDWRLDALDPEQEAAAAAAVQVESIGSAGSRPSAQEWQLIEALTYDARVPVAELARASQRNPATARRQLGQLLASGRLSFRCDLAHAAAGWPVSGSWFARVPAADVDATVAVLRSLPQLRLCASVTGEANLVFTVLSRSVRGLGRFEQTLGRRLPGVQLLEWTLHLRSVKRMGWMLDAAGRCTGEVVVPAVFGP